MLSLMVNVGKSSIRYKLYTGDKLVKNGVIEKIGRDDVLNHVQAWEKLYQGLGVDAESIEVVGHKLPLAKDKSASMLRLSSALLANLKHISESQPFALNPPIEVASLAMTIMPQAKHFGVFDDSFFNTLPIRATNYPLLSNSSGDLLKLDETIIMKRGGQGINHQYVLHQGQKDLGLIRTQRMISVHLGSYCSVCAIRDGECVDISGGMSAAEGLMGMSQVGDIDGGVVLSMVKNGISVEEIVKILGDQSGVEGLSGISADMRDVLYVAGYKVDDEKYIPSQNLPKDEDSINRARLAIEMFAYRVIKYIGAYIGVLGGVDCLVFTGAIGVGSSEIRSMILSKLDFINDFEVLVIEPNEEEQMRMMLENVSQDIK